MKIIRHETAYEGEYLRLVNRIAVTENQEEIVWETVEKKRAQGTAAIMVALTNNNELILERHWRAAIDTYIIQFPAGLCDKDDETIAAAARREFREETGYEASDADFLLKAPTNPVLSPMMSHYYLAKDVKFMGERNLDPEEEIEVILVPLDKVKEFFLNLPQDTELDLSVLGVLWLLEAKGIF